MNKVLNDTNSTNPGSAQREVARAEHGEGDAVTRNSWTSYVDLLLS